MLLSRSEADAVVTVLPVPEKHNPHWVYFRSPEGHLRLSTGEAAPIARRQDLPPAFHREGSVYVVRRDVLMDQNSLYGQRLVGHVLDPARCVAIDTVDDWGRAERLLEARAGLGDTLACVE
jgi:CMP-N-acetylneuraminic acid synthetase